MKEYKFGNTSVIIHSPLANMTDQEQKDWFQEQYEDNNPIILNMIDAIDACYTVSNESK
ncbi:hypothetical protein J5Y03_10240 [Bacillus sp. RG28]|uniref:Uncharacterized protein n=1 Tax=Gottfriedia endophytica TaxID=2820819 RepID=A0A940SGX1_9BACI|nr:hypothetical protein [Gottfriedia endophytica]MBP0725567.1 hypothetical protein [Gottfriedia endophytica]